MGRSKRGRRPPPLHIRALLHPEDLIQYTRLDAEQLLLYTQFMDHCWTIIDNKYGGGGRAIRELGSLTRFIRKYYSTGHIEPPYGFAEDAKRQYQMITRTLADASPSALFSEADLDVLPNEEQDAKIKSLESAILREDVRSVEVTQELQDALRTLIALEAHERRRVVQFRTGIARQLDVFRSAGAKQRDYAILQREEQYKIQFAEQESRHRQALEQLEQTHKAQLRQFKDGYEEELEKLRNQHAAHLKNVRARADKKLKAAKGASR